MNIIKFIEVSLKVIPAFAFFISFRIYFDIVKATEHLVISVLITNFIYLLIFRTLKRSNLMILGGTLLFALPTIFLQNPDYIKAKGVIVNTCLATLLLLAKLIFKKNLLSLVIHKKLECDESVMNRVCIMWAIFLYFAALLNFFVAFSLPSIFDLDKATADNIWVYFRTIGPPIINSSFTLFTMLYIYKKDKFIKEKVKNFFKKDKSIA